MSNRFAFAFNTPEPLKEYLATSQYGQQEYKPQWKRYILNVCNCIISLFENDGSYEQAKQEVIKTIPGYEYNNHYYFEFITDMIVNTILNTEMVSYSFRILPEKVEFSEFTIVIAIESSL